MVHSYSAPLGIQEDISEEDRMVGTDHFYRLSSI